MYLQRINYRPNTDGLTDAEKQYLAQHVDAYGAELVIDGDAIPWQIIEEVEIVKAARHSSLAGWFVKNIIMGGERYHLGIYFGTQEAVLTNTSLAVIQYVVKQIAYYAPQPIRYKGLPDVVAVVER